MILPRTIGPALSAAGSETGTDDLCQTFKDFRKARSRLRLNSHSCRKHLHFGMGILFAQLATASGKETPIFCWSKMRPISSPTGPVNSRATILMASLTGIPARKQAGHGIKEVCKICQKLLLALFNNMPQKQLWDTEKPDNGGHDSNGKQAIPQKIEGNGQGRQKKASRKTRTF